MFEYLGSILVNVDPGFDVLRYLTVRTLGGTVTALLITIIFGPLFINKLKSMQFEQYVRSEGPKSHYKKNRHSNYGRHFNNLIYVNFNPSLGRLKQ